MNKAAAALGEWLHTGFQLVVLAAPQICRLLLKYSKPKFGLNLLYKGLPP